jgi:hypothetical protein
MRPYQIDQPVQEIEISPAGCQQQLSRFMMIASVSLGAIAFLFVLVFKSAEKLFEAKASAAWARAAQLDAQANLVDARSAQLGMFFTGMLPIIIIGAVLFLVLAGVLLMRAGTNRTLSLDTYRLVEGDLYRLPPGANLNYPNTTLHVPDVEDSPIRLRREGE